MKTLTVVAALNPVAKEESPRRFIGGEPVEVPLTAYYLRRLADGELVEVQAKNDDFAEPSKTPAEAPRAKQSKAKKGDQ